MVTVRKYIDLTGRVIEIILGILTFVLLLDKSRNGMYFAIFPVLIMYFIGFIRDKFLRVTSY